MAQIAVVIPTFNASTYLLESVDSARTQTVEDIEIVVVDDGSTEPLPELPSDERIRVIRQTNLGAGAARNRGAAETDAPFVAFLDADDRWLPEKLERQLAALAATRYAVCCYTNFRYINPTGEQVSAGNAGPVAGYEDLLARCPVPLSSTIVRHEAFERVGGFDTAYAIAEDWDLWLRLSRIGSFFFLDETLTEYRVAPYNIGQLSGNPRRAFEDASAIYERERLAAERAGDARTLALVESGRLAMADMRARQAASRFVNSLGRHAEWAMLRDALAINRRAAAAETAGAVARRGRRALHRLLS